MTKRFQNILQLATGILLVALAACGDGKTTSNDAAPPYTIQLVEFINDSLPNLHSYTHAIYKDKIVMFGGKTNGLHEGDYNFVQKYANTKIYVIDTKNWSADPATWQVSSMSDQEIQLDKASGFVDKGQFRANNAQFFTKGEVLYVVGGLLGKDAIHNPNGPNTLPLFTAIDLPALTEMVVNKTAMPKGSIRQATNPNFALTGGELELMDNKVYLVFGWNFPGNTHDDYSHMIKTFSYVDDTQKDTLTAAFDPVCSTCWDFQLNPTDSGYYRRRDGSMSAMINPADESSALVYYSGVFKNGNTNFDDPIWIDKSGAKVLPFQMLSNVYTCEVVPVYSKSRKMSYATLLGGMKNAVFKSTNIQGPTLMDASNTTVIPPDIDSFLSVPFSNQFTTLSIDSKKNFRQYMLPDSFPPLSKDVNIVFVPKEQGAKPDTFTMTSKSKIYNGSESELQRTLPAKYYKGEGVLDYDAYIKDNPSGGPIGYLHGGILSGKANLNMAIENNTNQLKFSIASNRIFVVKLVPTKK